MKTPARVPDDAYVNAGLAELIRARIDDPDHLVSSLSRVWPGSHEREVRMTTVSQHGHLETVVDRNELTKYESCDITSDIGDVVIMDTHLLHSSNRNRTSDASRIVQLFRYSDLCDERAIGFGWASAERRIEPKIAFADFYPEKVQRDEAMPAAVRRPG
jgi:hypothetical protein